MLFGMRLTKNTNKATRTWVDSILSQLDLVLCEYSYRDAYTALKSCQICNDGKAAIVSRMTATRGCITQSERDMLLSLSPQYNPINLIETL